MSNNANLQTAKNKKNDEFYTLMPYIEKELQHYSFEGRAVYCNCDNPNNSNFWKYFVNNFAKLKITKIIATYYAPEGESYITEYNGNTFTKLPLKSNGDFRSKECVSIIREENPIVCTNPPFSLFREYVSTLIDNKCDFLIIGSMNSISCLNIFDYLKNNKMHLGVSNGRMEFTVPYDFNKNNVYEKDGIKYAKFGNICWYTNLEHSSLHQELKLTNAYCGNENYYPKYDNYEAISVSKLKEIPFDYFGEMGVPITIMQHLNKDQFEIVGNSSALAKDIEINGKYIPNPSRFYLNGNRLFDKIVIKRKI